jgi:methionyl-tRNA formyltransferase
LELRELPALTSRPPTPTATSSTEVPAAAKALQIAVVVDNPRSWFIPHAHNLVNHFREFGQAMFLSAATEIPAGTDFAFLLSCEKIVPPSILGRSRHNIVVHASDLPRGKGMSPLTWQVLEGKNIIPVTLFEAVADVDAGTIYLTDSVIFQGHELLPEMHAALGKKICQMCLRFLHEYPQAIKAGQEQTGTPTIYPRRHPEDSRLDPSKSIAEQFNLLRIVDNDRYPAFFEWQGKKYILRINQDRETKL